MAKKFGKFIALGAAVCAVTAGVYYYLQKRDTDEWDDEFDEEDIDDGSNTQNYEERNYVPLKVSPIPNTEEAKKDTTLPEKDAQAETANSKTSENTSKNSEEAKAVAEDTFFDEEDEFFEDNTESLSNSLENDETE